MRLLVDGNDGDDLPAACLVRRLQPSDPASQVRLEQLIWDAEHRLGVVIEIAFTAVTGDLEICRNGRSWSFSEQPPPGNDLVLLVQARAKPGASRGAAVEVALWIKQAFPGTVTHILQSIPAPKISST